MIIRSAQFFFTLVTTVAFPSLQYCAFVLFSSQKEASQLEIHSVCTT